MREDDGKHGMDTWPSTWFKSRTRPPLGCKRRHGERNDRPRASIAMWNLVSPRFDTMWDVSLRKIRRTDAVLVAMLRSQSFSADRGNQKPGIGGQRVMHAYCSMCMAWHSGIHCRAEKINRPDWAHGGLPRHSREQSQWRLNELGLGEACSRTSMARMPLELRGENCSSRPRRRQRRRVTECVQLTLYSMGA